jgi:hypothetical protein
MNKLNKIITEEIYRFISEGVADKYAEKQFHIPDDIKTANINSLSYIQQQEEKPYKIIKSLTGRPISIYLNPKSLKNFEFMVRAIADSSGNVYVEQTNSYLLHSELAERIGIPDNVHSPKYLLLNKTKGNNFILGESSEFYYQEDAKYRIPYENIVKAIKVKNPEYNIAI